MAGTATNVTAGKPKNGGAVFMAPVGTAAPTDANAALTGYTDLGFLSEDGVTENVAISTESIKEWGGGVVLITQTEKTVTLKFKLIEYLNADVQKFVNGDTNVTETVAQTAQALAVKINDKEADERVLVIDQIMRGNRPFRIVMPRAKITEMGEVTYKTNEAVGYDITVMAIKDDAGEYMYKYLGGATA